MKIIDLILICFTILGLIGVCYFSIRYIFFKPEPIIGISTTDSIIECHNNFKKKYLMSQTVNMLRLFLTGVTFYLAIHKEEFNATIQLFIILIGSSYVVWSVLGAIASYRNYVKK
ncbi:hypothetical protein ASF12_22950 [Paenibacillus sp. Leaf72]|nr:hypothetical protein ASF12_22950 [Paenibacillus sp. Leaf72]